MASELVDFVNDDWRVCKDLAPSVLTSLHGEGSQEVPSRGVETGRAVYPPGKTKTTGYWPEEGEHRSTTTAPHRVVRHESPVEETLHTWLRERMQELVQWALEAEVTELLGRARYQRRAEVDGVPGYRNGYGKPRKLTTPLGTVTLRRPRVRGVGGALCEPDPAAICPEDLGGRGAVAGAVPARAGRGGL
jgi:hypothetical protein